MPRTPLAALLALTLGLAACGGDGGGGDAGTVPLPGSPEEEVAPPTTFSATEFEPPFTIELPGGWQSTEVEPGDVQFVSGTTGGHALTFSSRLADTPVAEAAELMRTAPSLTATEPTEAMVAGHPGLVFTGEVQDDTEIPGIQYFAVSAFRMRFWAIDVDGRTVVLVADALATEAEPYFAEVDEVLGTLTFGEA